MEFINEYFKKKTNKITFIELKKGAITNIKGYPIDKDIPLPILTDVLVSEIIEGNMEEEIKLSNVIDGIIYLMGIDSLFMHMEDYKNILMSYNKKAEDYIFYQGIRSMEENDYDSGAVYFRALKYINPKNVNGIFNYAIALEEIAKGYFEKEENEKGIKFLDKSTNELETILDIDDKYPLAYYKLGYHYKFSEQYLKAKLIWTKHLILDKDELRLQEIRGEIELIENDVAMEAGLTYLSREYFDKALDIFLKLLSKFDKWWELKYLIGVCYKGLADFENAIDYFEEALELYKLDSNLYNELGICLFTIGDISNAVDVFTEGIENISDDYKLMFNRGLCYLQLGKLKDAYSDIQNAVILNPNDINMNTQKEALEKLINK
ncbi:tetratricopeptide repeat protein [Tissierella sp.]|uniref:tetratricopeptide repeat protein n=1 Tax=Tissierella sp. TaxID=41274 RepID=UPI0028AD13A0|nr:tetratricopeptide repeat protein [Tissierella sp.]